MFEQKMNVAGILTLSGKSKAGNQYTIHKLTVLDPIQVRGNVTQGTGYQAREFMTNEAVANKLNGAQFPAAFTCVLSMDQDNKLRVEDAHLVPKAADKPAAKAS